MNLMSGQLPKIYSRMWVQCFCPRSLVIISTMTTIMRMASGGVQARLSALIRVSKIFHNRVVTARIASQPSRSLSHSTLLTTKEIRPAHYSHRAGWVRPRCQLLEISTTSYWELLQCTQEFPIFFCSNWAHIQASGFQTSKTRWLQRPSSTLILWVWVAWPHPITTWVFSIHSHKVLWCSHLCQRPCWQCQQTRAYSATIRCSANRTELAALWSSQVAILAKIWCLAAHLTRCNSPTILVLT